MLRFCRKFGLWSAALLWLVSRPAPAQTQNLALMAASNFAASDATFDAPGIGPETGAPKLVTTPIELPRMTPELALSSFQQRLQKQLQGVPSYSATTVIAVDLADSRQHGVFELQREFSQPHSLRFTPMQYTGDGFVKSNVITRLLQQDVSQTEKNDGARTALTPQNYKLTFKGKGVLEGRAVYVFQVAPKSKLPGLFKGRIYLDTTSGALCRAEGELVKSPSFFIKKIKFTTDFVEVQGYSLPSHIHSDAETRIIGRATVDISNTGYAFTDAQVVLAAR